MQDRPLHFWTALAAALSFVATTGCSGDDGGSDRGGAESEEAGASAGGVAAIGESGIGGGDGVPDDSGSGGAGGVASGHSPSGGASLGTGGVSLGTGGAEQANGGASLGTGGAAQASGGASLGTGGAAQASGGVSLGTGGAAQASGGASFGTGGAEQASGGVSFGAGGTNPASGGDSGAAGTTAGGAGGWSAVAGAAGAGTGGAQSETGLGWPIDCVPNDDCTIFYPDIDDDGVAFDCGAPGYSGHQGTDISITWDAMDAGTDVYAAEAGEVLWVFDGHYDRCPNDAEPECQEPSLDMGPSVESGYMVCTDAQDEYCLGTEYSSDCFFCFYGSNVVVIRHPEGSRAFATRYDHLRSGSIVVAPGQQVQKGEKIAEVGSAGNSTGPHLHFEVWVGGFYVLAEPWAGQCGPNRGSSLWEPSLGF